MTKQTFSIEFAGRTLTVETGEIAKQANGAVVVRYGDTTVITAATMSKQMKMGDFFPLTINYDERYYAAGRFPGGFMKREARPSTDATLTARLIDRPIRPMFAEGFRNEVQVINEVWSYDADCTPRMSAMLGSSLALSISDIPFDGPIAGVEVGYIDGQYVINPTKAQKEASLLELSVAGTATAINMVESGAKELSEDVMLGALLAGHEAVKQLVDFQKQIVAAVGKPKAEVELLHVAAEFAAEVKAKYNAELQVAVKNSDKLVREAETQAVKDKAIAEYDARFAEDENHDIIMRDLNEILEQMEHAEVRRLIIEEKVRPDGRAIDEIRALDAQIDFLPRNIVHGDGLFTRGQTQSHSTLTLAPMSDTQIIDGLDPEYRKRFLHHYNFPQFSVGETGRYGAPGRREIGHGALGERALEQVLPSFEEFPYAIRLVAEVMESNGSSSQASICAGTLALMAGGVPIKAPVAGIAMGLISDGAQYTVLTDIQGLEDHFGDMDFKVAGTREGITALQMDIKIQGINEQILREALAQAKVARMQILDVIQACIPEPRKELAPSAPKIESFRIPADKIRLVIGKGGETIQGITADTGVAIDLTEDEQGGLVAIYSNDQVAINEARRQIEEIIRDAKVGDIYEGKVVRAMDSAIFVNLFGKVDARVHISEMAWGRTAKVEDVAKLGDTVKVKVTKISDKGVDASMRELVEKPEGYVEPERSRDSRERRARNGERGGYNQSDRRPRRDGDRPRRSNDHGFEQRERKSGDFPEMSSRKPD